MTAATINLPSAAAFAGSSLALAPYLGNNLLWPDQCGHLVDVGSPEDDYPVTWNVDRLQALRDMTPAGATLRYPGGSLADTFDPVAAEQRQSIDRGDGRSERCDFAPRNFTDLCRLIGVRSLITANMAYADAVDVARKWESFQRQQIQASTLIECGNEPYLWADGQDQFFVRLSNLLKVLPSASTALIPYAPAAIGDFPFAADPAYPQKVLRAIGDAKAVKRSALAIHHHLPFTPGLEPWQDAYVAAQAGTIVSRDVFAARLACQTSLGVQLPVAVTEHSCYVDGRPEISASMVGAVTMFEMLVGYLQSGVSFACLWSALGNNFFGAVSDSGERRPLYWLYSRLAKMARGKVLVPRIDQPLLPVDASVHPILSGITVGVEIVALASRDAETGTTTVLVANKNLTEPLTATLNLAQPTRGAKASAIRPGDDGPLAPSYRAGVEYVDARVFNAFLTLPPASITAIELSE